MLLRHIHTYTSTQRGVQHMRHTCFFCMRVCLVHGVKRCNACLRESQVAPPSSSDDEESPNAATGFAPHPAPGRCCKPRPAAPRPNRNAPPGFKLTPPAPAGGGGGGAAAAGCDQPLLPPTDGGAAGSGGGVAAAAAGCDQPQPLLLPPTDGGAAGGRGGDGGGGAAGCDDQPRPPLLLSGAAAAPCGCCCTAGSGGSGGCCCCWPPPPGAAAACALRILQCNTRKHTPRARVRQTIANPQTLEHSQLGSLPLTAPPGAAAPAAAAAAPSFAARRACAPALLHEPQPGAVNTQTHHSRRSR